MDNAKIESIEGLNLSIVLTAIITEKKLIFSAQSYNFETKLLDNLVIKLVNGNYEITDYEVVSYCVLKHYKQEFNFEINIVFNSNVEFLKTIDLEFQSNGHVPNFHILKKHLWQWVIKESNSKYNSNFSDYLNSLNKENNTEEIFCFIDAYSAVLPILKLSPEFVYSNSIILFDFAKSDAQYNIPFSNLFNSIKQICLTSYDFGLELYKLAFGESTPIDNMISSIVAGLYEAKKEEFLEGHLRFKIDDNVSLNAIFFGLSNIKELRDSECILFLQLYDRFKNQSDLIISLLTMLMSIIRSSNILHYKLCFERISDSIQNENTTYFILHNITYLDYHEEEKSNFLVGLIEQEYFTADKYLVAIGHCFFFLKGISSFKKVILALVERLPFCSISKGFQSFLYSVDKIEFDQFLIELLTDNRASKRFAAINLFDELSKDNGYKFAFDILKLEPIIQYKLWVSLTQDFKEPKYHIPALLPLLNSESEFIKESLICKLEEISEDYGGHVRSILETNLDLEKEDYKLIIQRINRYVDEFYSKNVDVKKSIKEFDPNYTQYKSIRYYYSLFQKKMSQAMSEGAEENSLIGILGANTVQIAKGGGWRFGDRKEISKLGKIESSFALPRSYFINPNKYEMEKGLEGKTDWRDSDFVDIQKILKNE